MADPQSYRPATSDIPVDPGVYRFLDDAGRILYVGKAKSLRKRLVSYFRDPAKLHPRTRQMVFSASQVKWVVVKSELEALTLEYAWIKEYNPRYNVMYRDDKSYPYLAVTTSEEYPRLIVTRNAHRKGNRYYGPYTQVRAVRDSLDLLLKVFPVRSCSAGVFNQAQRSGRPCLNGYIEKCIAPCVNGSRKLEHDQIIQDLVKYLDSNGESLIKQKQAEMLAASEALEFEQAAKLRDQVHALQTISERNTVVLDKHVDADVFGFVKDELEASVQVFHVRGGRVRGQRGWITELAGLTDAELVSQLLLQVYGAFSQSQLKQRKRSDAKSVDDVAHTATSAIPREIWLPLIPDDAAAIESWISELRGAAIIFKTPQRGIKSTLLDTVNLNAQQALQRHKLQRVGDLGERAKALEELRRGLRLERSPLRIECFDISHTQGTHQVGSMVVFEDGVPQKSEYRLFNIRGADGKGARDDTEAMQEVLTRRLSKQQNPEPEDADQEAGTKPRRRFAYTPDLLVVDGGLPQVNAAAKIVQEFAPEIKVIGLAKRLEEVWIPGKEFPVILPRTSPALYLLQYLRDESHRFAIKQHRKKRTKAMTVSVLDEIPGLGTEKQKALLRKFKSVKQIRNASVEELQQVSGIGPKLAKVVLESLQK